MTIFVKVGESCSQLIYAVVGPFRISHDSKEQYFDFCLESHYLIYSKSKKNYLYIWCHRDSFYTGIPSVYDMHDVIDNYVLEVFKKKINKVQFFEFIMEEHKKTGLFQEYFDKDLYTSTFGIDYYDLYLKGKLK